MIRSACVGALLLALLSPSSARARGDAGPIAASLVPGVVVHGAGHFVAGERAIAGRLLLVEAVGVTMTGASLAIIAATGASRRVVAPLAVTTVTGVGLIALSLLSDVYGVVAPHDGFGAARRPVRHALETSAGVRGVHDPQFRYGAVFDQSIDVRVSRLHLRSEAATAPASGYSRVAGLFGVQVAGSDADGSLLDLEAVVSHRAYRNDGFSALTFEARATGRLDLQRFARTLRGSFAELQVGTAIASYHYAHGGREGDDLLLLRLAYGVYLGKRSEVSLFYDHRRDTIAGGGLVRGIPAGYLGFFGVDARYFIDEQWGIALDARAGGAYIAGASLLFRQGARAW